MLVLCAVTACGLLLLAEYRVRQPLRRLGIALSLMFVSAYVALRIGTDAGSAQCYNEQQRSMAHVLDVLQECAGRQPAEAYRAHLAAVRQQLPSLLAHPHLVDGIACDGGKDDTQPK